MRHPAFSVSLALVALAALPAATLLPTVAARAASFTVSSTDPGFSSFVNDNDVSPPITFTTVDPFTQVNITSDSFANLGGFDLTFALFNNTGDPTTLLLLGQSSDVDFDNGLFDDVLTAIIPAGNYSVYVTQWDNTPNGPFLSDGFLQTNPHYTQGTFQDINGVDHNGSWRITVNTVAVPEAGTAALLLPFLAAEAVGVVRRRRATERTQTNG